MANVEEVKQLRSRFGYDNVLHPFSATDLKYLAPGEYKAGIAIDDDNGQEGIYSRVANRFGFVPPNNEFEYGPQLTGNRACSFNAGLYGVSATQCATSTVPGREPTIRRKAVGGYTADKAKCCAGLPDGDRTCDPKNIGAASVGCSDIYTGICGANPLDPRCATWGANNKAMYRQFLTDYCGRNIGSTACQEAILREGISVDSQYDLYCDSHPSVPFCACKIPKNLPTPKFLEDWMAQTPSCFNGQCIAGGYKTAGQKSQSCPSSVSSCVSQNNAKTGGEISGNTMTCIQGATGLPSKVDVKPAGTTPPTTAGATPTTMVAIVLIILVILSAIYVRFMSSTAFSSLPRSQSALA